MIPKEELTYKLLNYIVNKHERNRMVSIQEALEDLNLEDYIPHANELAKGLEYEGYVKTITISRGRVGITNYNLTAKYFIEEYLSQNSNLNDIKETIQQSKSIENINIQLRNAERYLTSNNPLDYSNAIKESIGAAETTVKICINDSNCTLGKGLKKISDDGNLHSALEKGISSLYGYSSDSGAVRHGLKPNESISFDYSQAKFLVSIYSNLVNYLIEKYNLT